MLHPVWRWVWHTPRVNQAHSCLYHTRCQSNVNYRVPKGRTLHSFPNVTKGPLDQLDDKPQAQAFFWCPWLQWGRQWWGEWIEWWWWKHTRRRWFGWLTYQSALPQLFHKDNSGPFKWIVIRYKCDNAQAITMQQTEITMCLTSC